ncbi:unnamed protein product, partial [Mesorhabditis belari]|uniref:SCP domain-containing protein n=1 Tax=Mesorhabditis belari TaxID=2138241 RepID=A0AAF3EI97_9BILA
MQINDYSAIGLALAEARIGLRKNRFQQMVDALQRVSQKIEIAHFPERIAQKMTEKLGEIIEQAGFVFSPSLYFNRPSLPILPKTIVLSNLEKSLDENDTTIVEKPKTMTTLKPGRFREFVARKEDQRLLQNLGYNIEENSGAEPAIAKQNSNQTLAKLSKKVFIDKLSEMANEFKRIEQAGSHKRSTVDEMSSTITLHSTVTPVTPTVTPELPKVVKTWNNKTSTSNELQMAQNKSQNLAGLENTEVDDEISCGGSGTHQISRESKMGMLEATNRFRSEIALGKYVGFQGRVFPSATNMRKLKWSCALEKKAQSWAHSCQMSHASRIQRMGQGEILFFPSQKPQHITAFNLSTMAFFYNDEFKMSLTESPLKMDHFNWKFVGHATQQAWAVNDAIGCAVASCLNEKLWVVCRYSTGNNLGSLVYEEGAPCSRCPADTKCRQRTALCESKE